MYDSPQTSEVVRSKRLRKVDVKLDDSLWKLSIFKYELGIGKMTTDPLVKVPRNPGNTQQPDML